LGWPGAFTPPNLSMVTGKLASTARFSIGVYSTLSDTAWAVMSSSSNLRSESATTSGELLKE
jgi:hypothetical protein